jgi:hypothetical protein
VAAATTGRLRRLNLGTSTSSRVGSTRTRARLRRSSRNHFRLGSFPSAINLCGSSRTGSTTSGSKSFGAHDPVFPATKIVLGPNQQFETAGLERKHWTNASPIRTIFKAAFENAGLPYFNPHSFRKTLVHLGEKVCRTPE